MNIAVLPLSAASPEWVASFLDRHSSARVVSRGRLHYPAGLDGFVGTRGGRPVALVTYRIEGSECEIVTLHSEVEGVGLGTALIDRVRGEAADAGCTRLWLVTTNDNTHALRFYQRRGFQIVAVYPGALDEYRRALKPEIPATGNDGIALRDEIELETYL